MSEKTRSRMEKFVALCDSGKPWYVFLAMFSILLAAHALLELLTDQRAKWWVWVLNVAGILSCLGDIFYCRKRRAEKAAEVDAE